MLLAMQAFVTQTVQVLLFHLGPILCTILNIVGIEKDFQSMTAVELLNNAESLLDQANKQFKLGEYEKATTRYDESLQLLQRIPRIRHDDIPICTEPIQVEGRKK